MIAVKKFFQKIRHFIDTEMGWFLTNGRKQEQRNKNSENEII